MHRATIAVAMLVALLALSCSKKEETAFELAEDTFNRGLIVPARDLYAQFIAEFPTSRWRPIADRQLDKCLDIARLQTAAARSESMQDYSQAAKEYRLIAELNPLVIDTMAVIPRLHELKEARRRHLANEAARQDSIREAITSSRNASFLSNLRLYADAVDSCAQRTLSLTNFILVSSKELEEFQNSFIAEAISLIRTDGEHQPLVVEVRKLYGLVKNPPPPHAGTRTDVTRAFESLNKLHYALDHLENYSRFTLNQKIAEAGAEISASTTALRMYLASLQRE